MNDVSQTTAVLELPHRLTVARLGIDTYQEPVIYMRKDCHVCRSEGFEAQSRIRVALNGRSIIATLNVVTSDLLATDRAALSESAWRLLDATDNAQITVSHAPPVDSLSHVRAKIYGRALDTRALRSIIGDIAAGLYSDLELSAFITACAGDRLDLNETTYLTQSMIDVGQTLTWHSTQVMDKHCVGGLPGNRTTLLVVPIVASCGLLIPKTSSRAITSPAGTADTMETLAPVSLDVPAMRGVVEETGGCIVWGGAVALSPADDILIRVESPLDLDSPAQLVASVLSKKAAAGATDVVIDIPVGPTAKVRTPEAAAHLTDMLVHVGKAIGLAVRCISTDGREPVGGGIGPALEARDVLAVLRGNPDASRALRDRAAMLAGELLEMAGKAPPGAGSAAALAAVSSGEALRKFEAICEAQGGMRTPPASRHRHVIGAARTGHVALIDNRRLARIAKLAGAPKSPAAGIDLHTPVGQRVEAGEPLFTVHAETPGELAYALDYARAQHGVIVIDETI